MPGTVASQFTVKPSARFAVVLLLLHITAVAAVYATAIPWTAKLVMYALILPSLLYYLARDVLLMLPYSWREISLDQREVSVVTRDGTVSTGRVANKTFVSPYFIVMCIKREGLRLSMSRVIFPDAMSIGTFRGLCVHLKFS